MNAADGQQPPETRSAPSSTFQTPLTAGQMLRAAREARGLHLAVLSVNLKVSVRQLEALEADRHDALKGSAFVRALALSVCRQLKLDPAAVMAALPKGDVPKVLEPVAARAAKASVRSAPRPTHGKGLSKQVMLLALLMLLGAGVLVWWPNIHLPDTAKSDQVSAAAVVMGQGHNVEQIPAPMGEASGAASESSATASDANSAPAPALSAAPATVSAPAPLPKSDAIKSATQPAALAAAAAPAPVPASSVTGQSSERKALVLQLKANAWVEIRDKFRGVALKRQVNAGETVALELEAPVFVYTSRADSTELLWHGKSLALTPYTVNNELRIQIKP